MRHYIDDFSVAGLTSNPTIFENALKDAVFFDETIQHKAAAGTSGEALFLELALENLRQAADLFHPVHDKTGGIDGWVSLEVLPLLAEEAIYTGVPVNVTLLLSRQQYLAVADAYIHGIERQLVRVSTRKLILWLRSLSAAGMWRYSTKSQRSFEAILGLRLPSAHTKLIASC